ALFVVLTLVVLLDGPGGHLLGPVAVAARLLGLVLDVLVHPLFKPEDFGHASPAAGPERCRHDTEPRSQRVVPGRPPVGLPIWRQTFSHSRHALTHSFMISSWCPSHAAAQSRQASAHAWWRWDAIGLLRAISAAMSVQKSWQVLD